MLGVRPPEHLAHVPGLGMAVYGQVSAVDGVQVVEPDGERGAEPVVHVRTEQVHRGERREQLERDFDGDLRRRANQHAAALRGDQFVAERAVVGLRVVSQFPLAPLAAPRGGVERRAGPVWPPREGGAGGAQRVAVQPGRVLGVTGVQPQVDPVHVRVPVPVQQRPVDVEQPAGGRAVVGGGEQVAPGAGHHGRLGVALGQVGPPQHVRVAHGGRARSNEYAQARGRTRLLLIVEQVGQGPVGEHLKMRVVSECRRLGTAFHFVPRQTGFAQVDHVDGTARGQFGGHRFGRTVPVEHRWTVDREDSGGGRQGRGGGGPAEPDRAGGGWVMRLGVVRGRSRHGSEPYRKLPITPRLPVSIAYLSCYR